jgi:hypothetical protein
MEVFTIGGFGAYDLDMVLFQHGFSFESFCLQLFCGWLLALPF